MIFEQNFLKPHEFLLRGKRVDNVLKPKGLDSGKVTTTLRYKKHNFECNRHAVVWQKLNLPSSTQMFTEAAINFEICISRSYFHRRRQINVPAQTRPLLFSYIFNPGKLKKN